LQPVVTVASSERELIDWLVTRTGSGVTSLDAPTPLRARPAFRSKVYGERAVLLCQVLLPHLRAKAEQARLIAAFPMGDDARRDLHLADGAIDRQRLYVRDAIYALNHPPNATEAEERGEDSTLPRSA
jgi:hypothetical protein